VVRTLKTRARRGSAATVRVRAYAKLNLGLEVLGPRQDGYHELRTVFQTIELHDTLVCSDTPGPFTLKCRTPGVPLDADNLVWNAAAALWTALGRAGDIRDAAIQILIRGTKIAACHSGEIPRILLEHRLVQMIFGFEIGDDFRRQLALAIEGPAGREPQKDERQAGHGPENDHAMNEAFH